MASGPVTTFTCPVLLEPDGSAALTVIMQPLHEPSLHDVRQRDTGTARDPDKYLVKLAVVLQILEVLIVRLLLPGNSWRTRRTLSTV